MSERRSRNNERQNPTITLRKSPRFLRVNQSDVENPGTPKTAPRIIVALRSYSTPLGSSVTKTQKNCGGISKNGEGKSTELKSSSRKGSARLDCGANLGKNEKGQDLQEEYVIEKRVTRSSVRGIKFLNNDDKGCNGISQKGDTEVGELKKLTKSGKGSGRSARLECGTNLSTNEKGPNSPKQYVVEKRATRSSIRRSQSVKNQVSDCIFEEEKLGDLSKEDNNKVGVNLCESSSIGKIEKRVTRSSTRAKTIRLVEKDSNVSIESSDKRDVELSEPRVSKRKMQIGQKRKRHQVEEECEIARAWTKKQELALQRAYLTAKPTPHFWKRVAKMVPGKSAEECFDRIHSDHLTPSQPRTRSRPNKKVSSPLSFSASKLLSPAETEKAKKKLRPTKKNTLQAQKTVRELLQKQQNEGQDYEPDFFSLLEPTIDPSSPNLQLFASPTPNLQSRFLARCRETSSSAHKKQFSRLSGLSKTAFVSPPVLKQVKNKALHEKYIDQLHCREAKRKAESLRKGKGKSEKKASDLNVNSVKVAKDALAFDAQDAISQFRNLQSSMIGDGDDDDDDDDKIDGDEDEGEDEFC